MSPGHRPPKLPDSLLRPQFDCPVLPPSLRFSSDPFDPLAAHRKLGQRAPLGPLAPTGPNLYEVAALTSELDTQLLTTKVKEILLANNVGQKVKSSLIFSKEGGQIPDIMYMQARVLPA